ncbi:MAG: hypothetical protein NC041_09365 [Bacteroides sp.]|nr:hypothetical protein [Prevotella sp.]MCM1408745.1 hypothetical protein [Treponema brennaborense]MCM1470660.1 hypothetical protein [Bacteroides sp.]
MEQKRNRQNKKQTAANRRNEDSQSRKNDAHQNSGSFQSKQNKNRTRNFYSAPAESSISEKPVLRSFICTRCSKPITDLSAALAEKESGEPIHFDCVLEFLKQQEPLKTNEKLIYIGQGRFAVAYFENPHDLRHFSIRKIIEWEERDKKYDWRSEISSRYSQVK